MIEQDPRASGAVHFPSTAWSVVARAGGDTEGARVALSELCERYWFPLYAFLRRRGESSHNAEEIVQEFLTAVIERDVVKRADAERGKFRTFLLAALKTHLARKYHYDNAAKRSTSAPLLSIDTMAADERYASGLATELTPEKQFEHAWAIQLVDRTLARLAEEANAKGKEEQFSLLRGVLTAQRTLSAREAAEQLGMTEGAVRVAVHRWRKRYAELLREEVAQTVDEPDDINAEIDDLLSALRPPSQRIN